MALRTYADELAARLTEMFPPERVASQLADVVAGVSRRTEFTVRTDAAGESVQVPTSVSESTSPDNQLKGLLLLDTLAGGNLGLGAAAQAHRRLDRKHYAVHLRPLNSQIVSSRRAEHQLAVRGARLEQEEDKREEAEFDPDFEFEEERESHGEIEPD